MRISNDDNKMIDVSQRAAERILPVNGTASARNHPQFGNELPAQAAKPEQSAAVVEAVDAAQLDEAVKKINETMQLVQREIHFSVDKDSGKTVIKVIDLATDEVIRQIPNEEALSFARNLGDGGNIKLFSEYM